MAEKYKGADNWELNILGVNRIFNIDLTLLITRRVRGNIRWSLLSKGTYSHTWVFPSVRFVLSVLFPRLLDWLIVLDWRATDGYFLPYNIQQVDMHFGMRLKFLTIETIFGD